MMMQGQTLTLKFESFGNPRTIEAVLATHGIDISGVINQIYPDAAAHYDEVWKQRNHDPLYQSAKGHTPQRQQEAFAPSTTQPQTVPQTPGPAVTPNAVATEEPGPRVPTARKYFFPTDMESLTARFLDGRGAACITDPVEKEKKLRELAILAADEQKRRAHNAEVEARGGEPQFCHSQDFAKADYEVLCESMTYAAQKHGYAFKIV